MRVALPNWQGRVSPVFDVARGVVLVDVDGGGPVERTAHHLVQSEPLARARELAGFGVDVLICGAISQALERGLAAEGVQIVSRTCGPVDEVLQAYLQGRLAGPAFRMPGCGRRKRTRRRPGRGRCNRIERQEI